MNYITYIVYTCPQPSPACAYACAYKTNKSGDFGFTYFFYSYFSIYCIGFERIASPSPSQG